MQATTALIFRIALTVAADETEFEIKQDVEHALNAACTKLEELLTNRSISYKISEVVDISA